MSPMSTNHADVADVAVCMESRVAGDCRYNTTASHCLIILQARGLPHVYMLLIFAVVDDHANAEGMSPPKSSHVELMSP